MDVAKAPPAWARNLFYFLIGSTLSICVVTFIMRASCLFSEPNLHSISYAVVTFGVGLSISCGILWIGGVTSIISISEKTQRLLWITFISAILAITVTVYKAFFNYTKMYTVTGIVVKEDGKAPEDILISTQFPPLYPTPAVKKNVSVIIAEKPNGKFPKLAFSHPAYITEDIDLNDRTIVDINGETLTIKKAIKLLPMPGN